MKKEVKSLAYTLPTLSQSWLCMYCQTGYNWGLLVQENCMAKEAAVRALHRKLLYKS